MTDEIRKQVEEALEAYDLVFLADGENGGAEEIWESSEKKVLLLSAPKYSGLVELYYTYEFSDHIHLLSDHPQYGGLDNYVRQGLLSEEEASAAMLK